MNRSCVRFTMYVFVQLSEVEFIKSVPPVRQLQTIRKGIPGTNAASSVFNEALYVGVAWTLFLELVGSQMGHESGTYISWSVLCDG